MSFAFNYQWSYYPLTEQLAKKDRVVSTAITVKFFPIWYKQATLEISIPPTWGGCLFNVYRSADPDSNYVKLNSVPLNQNYFKDTTSTQYSKYNRDFYIVEVLFENGKSIQSEPQTWKNTRSTWVQLRANEIQRREDLLLRKFTGIESYLFKIKTYGARCKACWNYEVEMIMTDNCPTCLNTSFEGGYFTGIPVLLQYEPTPDDLSYTYFGKFESSQISAWCLGIPEIKARDVIYRVPDQTLYYVEDWANTELQTVTVRQLLKLNQLDKFSPEYKLATQVFPPEFQT